MLARLAEGQANVSEIAEPFLEHMSLPAVTKHLKVLERAGLVTKTQDAQRRLCDLNPEGFKDAIDFIDHYKQMMEESLDRLGEYLETVTAEANRTKGKKKHAQRKKNK